MPGARPASLAIRKARSARPPAPSMRSWSRTMAELSRAFDPRVTPARPDLAARHLEGSVAAARFAAGDVREVIEPIAALRPVPSPDAPLDTEALKGERVT